MNAQEKTIEIGGKKFRVYGFRANMRYLTARELEEYVWPESYTEEYGKLDCFSDVAECLKNYTVKSMKETRRQPFTHIMSFKEVEWSLLMWEIG